MISRVAESCFWLHRYIERATNVARLLRVHRSFILDIPVPELERWHSLIIVTGEQKRFAELHADESANDPEIVQSYLTWSEDSPVSISTSMHWARENARTIREVVSAETWEVLNGFHHWLRRGQGRRAWNNDRDAFYREVIQIGDLIYGTELATMLHQQAFDFMRLGAMLERAAQTARILDVKHHVLGRTRGKVESALELAQWSALLHSCSASEPFFKRTGAAPTGSAVVEFLLREPHFPRSVFHCIERATNFLRRIQPANSRAPRTESVSATEALVATEALLAFLRERSADAILEEGIHAVLTHVIDTTAEICQTIHSEFFDPPIAAVESVSA